MSYDTHYTYDTPEGVPSYMNVKDNTFSQQGYDSHTTYDSHIGYDLAIPLSRTETGRANISQLSIAVQRGTTIPTEIDYDSDIPFDAGFVGYDGDIYLH